MTGVFPLGTLARDLTQPCRACAPTRAALAAVHKGPPVAEDDSLATKLADRTYVPRIPPHRLGGGLFWREDGWFARIGVLHAFPHIELATNETPTPGFTNLKAELSYTRPLDRTVYGVSELTLGVKGENLLNEDIRNSASFKKDEILLPGRSAKLFLSARF